MDTAVHSYFRNAQEQDREKLILDHIGFVRQILSKMTFQIEDEDERQNLYSSGMVGLVEAANSFDTSRGVAFRTFAYPRIRGAILDELRKLSPVSQATLQQIGKVKKAYQNLEPPVTPEDLADESGLSVADVTKCLEAMRFLKPQDWSDFECVVHSSWQTPHDSPQRTVEQQELKTVLAHSITQLPERERLILTMYYSEELTLLEIGKVLDLSESQISRSLASAKFRLKELVKTKFPEEKTT